MVSEHECKYKLTYITGSRRCVLYKFAQIVLRDILLILSVLCDEVIVKSRFSITLRVSDDECKNGLTPHSVHALLHIFCP